jgi:hypothetical protein
MLGNATRLEADENALRPRLLGNSATAMEDQLPGDIGVRLTGDHRHTLFSSLSGKLPSEMFYCLIGSTDYKPTVTDSALPSSSPGTLGGDRRA